jgi:hypothetical protein
MIPPSDIEVGSPLVTAVMTTGKTKARHRLAREAVLCFLEQTYRPRELLIINDGEEKV